MQNREEFYNKLKMQLDDTGKWPGQYMYKFIVPSKGDGVKQIEDIFSNLGAVIQTRASKTGKYTSLSIRVIVDSSEQIISLYKSCENIEGIVSL